jgi:hypothetical protein
MQKSYVELFLAGMLVLNCDTSSVQRSIKPIIEPSIGLLYHALADPLKLVNRILHMASLF